MPFKTTQVKDIITKKEIEVLKLKHVLQYYPDAVSDNYDFFSKTINKDYQHLDFYSSYSLYVYPYSKLDFEHNGTTEEIKIFSLPKKVRLAYIRWLPGTRKREVNFNRLHINMKTNAFDDKMLADCQQAIVKWMSKNPDTAVNAKHLDPRLKKLLAFS